MALVAASALVMCGLHGGPEPGWHLGASGLRAGFCRDVRGGRSCLPDGHRGEYLARLGLWRDPRGMLSGRMVAGLEWRDGSAWARGPGGSALVW